MVRLSVDETIGLCCWFWACPTVIELTDNHDTTAVVAMTKSRLRAGLIHGLRVSKYRTSIQRCKRWIVHAQMWRWSRPAAQQKQPWLAPVVAKPSANPQSAEWTELRSSTGPNYGFVHRY